MADRELSLWTEEAVVVVEEGGSRRAIERESESDDNWKGNFRSHDCRSREGGNQGQTVATASQVVTASLTDSAKLGSCWPTENFDGSQRASDSAPDFRSGRPTSRSTSLKPRSIVDPESSRISSV